VVAEVKPRGQAGVIKGAGEVGASFAEVGPAVVVGRDDHVGAQDRGRGGHPDAVQAQCPVPELARDAGGAGVQDSRVDGRGAPGDLGDGADGGVVAADVDGGQILPGQDEADDLAVDEAVGVTLGVFGAVHGGDGGRAAHDHGRALLPRHHGSTLRPRRCGSAAGRPPEQNHDNVALSWFWPPRCDTVVVAGDRRGRAPGPRAADEAPGLRQVSPGSGQLHVPVVSQAVIAAQPAKDPPPPVTLAIEDSLGGRLEERGRVAPAELGERGDQPQPHREAVNLHRMIFA
jgi:hypothetical protein